MSDFDLDLTDFIDEIEADADQVVRKVTLDLMNEISANNPVRTGRSRANWNISQGAPDTSVVEKTFGKSRNESDGPSAAFLKQKSEAAVEKIKAGQTVFITNNVEYLADLNNGTPEREGQHFVELAIENTREELGL